MTKVIRANIIRKEMRKYIACTAVRRYMRQVNMAQETSEFSPYAEGSRFRVKEGCRLNIKYVWHSFDRFKFRNEPI